mmetsp:Transcript_32267/g.65629  ORF Transcript_32267/g.65629 Transcript_32267/m.65629 type:complete len:698 (+) Transcript_32267:77-2170(+)
MESRDNNYYDVRAQDVKLEDITSSAHNAKILRMLRDDDLASTEEEEGALYIVDYTFDHGNTFFVKEGDDWGWLGYFIGRNKQIRDLHLYCLPKDRDQVGAFMEGMKHNRSIEEFRFHHEIEIEGDSIIDRLAPFIIHNTNLKELRLLGIHFGLDCVHSLAVALIQRQHKALTCLSLEYNNLSNEALEEIIAALSGYKKLESLCVEENLSRRDQKYYDMLAEIIDLNRITSSKKNAEILRKLRDNAWNEKKDLYVADYDDSEGDYFCAEEGDDWGWLGYFVGRNKQIRGLNLYCLPEEEDEVDAFMEGLCRDQSIERLDIRRCEIDFSSLSPFIVNNGNLKDLRLFDVDIFCAHSLAMALSQRQHKSLTAFCFSRNNLSNDALEEISAALTGYPYLESFCVLENNLIGRDGCESLGTIFRSSALYLKEVLLCGNDFDDEDLQTLVAALTNATTLQSLWLSSNRSIAAAGLRALSQLFSSASVCPLETLHIEDMNIGDEGAEALVDGLRGNTTLKHLVLTPDSAGITSTGWAAFSRLLCDTSSINNTYRSNHTLEHIGDDYCYMSNPDGSGKLFLSGDAYSGECFRGIPPAIVQYLKINKEYHSLQDAATIKIGRCHPDIPVEVFFEYKLKLLPFLVSWFGRFGTRERSNCQNATTREFQRRELSAVYKFIRGMPMLAVDGQIQMRLKSSCGRKRKFDE